MKELLYVILAVCSTASLLTVIIIAISAHHAPLLTRRKLSGDTVASCILGVIVFAGLATFIYGGTHFALFWMPPDTRIRLSFLSACLGGTGAFCVLYGYARIKHSEAGLAFLMKTFQHGFPWPQRREEEIAILRKSLELPWTPGTAKEWDLVRIDENAGRKKLELLELLDKGIHDEISWIELKKTQKEERRLRDEHEEAIRLARNKSRPSGPSVYICGGPDPPKE